MAGTAWWPSPALAHNADGSDGGRRQPGATHTPAEAADACRPHTAPHSPIWPGTAPYCSTLPHIAPHCPTGSHLHLLWVVELWLPVRDPAHATLSIAEFLTKGPVLGLGVPAAVGVVEGDVEEERPEDGKGGGGHGAAQRCPHPPRPSLGVQGELGSVGGPPPHLGFWVQGNPETGCPFLLVTD